MYLPPFTFGLFINSLSPELINRPCDLGHLQPGIVTCGGNVRNKGKFIFLLGLQVFVFSFREGNCLLLCLAQDFLVLLLFRVCDKCWELLVLSCCSHLCSALMGSEGSWEGSVSKESFPKGSCSDFSSCCFFLQVPNQLLLLTLGQHQQHPQLSLWPKMWILGLLLSHLLLQQNLPWILGDQHLQTNLSLLLVSKALVPYPSYLSNEEKSKWFSRIVWFKEAEQLAELVLKIKGTRNNQQEREI